MVHQHMQTGNIYSTCKHHRRQYYFLKTSKILHNHIQKFVGLVLENGNMSRENQLRLAKLC